MKLSQFKWLLDSTSDVDSGICQSSAPGEKTTFAIYVEYGVPDANGLRKTEWLEVERSETTRHFKTIDAAVGVLRDAGYKGRLELYI